MKIAVLSSGGVDSAFSLVSLKKQGHDVSAHYIKIWNPQYEETGTSCPWKDDVDFTRRLCDQFNIELHIHNLQLEYEFTVLEYMLSELKKGLTPNPDVLCNYFIKFGIFFDHVNINEYDFAASGHYATKINNNDDHIYWHQSDPKKDQSFFLSKLKPNQIKKIIFPCSNLNKSQIRQYAKDWNLPQKERKDSQGLCFLGKLNYSEFISRYIPIKKGPVFNIENDQLIGEHNGLHLHTEGQKININNPNGPWFVFNKNIKDNSIHVINRNHFHKYETNIINISDLSINPNEYSDIFIKLRHPQEHLLPATLINNSQIQLSNTIKPFQLSPGQITAIYQKNINGYKLLSNAKITKG